MPYADPEKKRANARKWYEENREKKLKYARKHYDANRAEYWLRNRRWVNKNRVRHNEIVLKSYHKRRAAAQAEWNEIMAEIQGATNV